LSSPHVSLRHCCAGDDRLLQALACPSAYQLACSFSCSLVGSARSSLLPSPSSLVL
jgi:hypothetical protein